MKTLLSHSRRCGLLEIDDLTQNPNHAIHLMAQEVARSVLPSGPVETVGGSPIVQATHNYDLLGYPADSVVKESAYTHWVDDAHILRTQTTSLILQALLERASKPAPAVLLAPGMVYRRDVRDRWHCAQPHQMDVWCLMAKKEEGEQLLMEQIRHLVKSTTAMEEDDIQVLPTSHPYTRSGVEVSVRWQERWLEIGEAGLISPALLERTGIDPQRWGGLAMGWGLDRLVMARKGLPDIRLLRDPLPDVARQMNDLDPWRPVSRQPAATREISVAMARRLGEEEIVERVLGSLDGEAADLVQSVEILGRWPVEDLHEVARARLGALDGQENLLVRVVWQSESSSLARREVNAWMRRIYQGVHQGEGWDYCP